MEGESQQHEEGDGLVGGAPLQEDLRLELVEYLMEDLFGDAEGGGTEEDPAGCYEVEGEDAAYELHGSVRSGRGVFLAGQIGERAERRRDGMPHLVDAEEDAMDGAPEDEVEGCAVPKSSQQHGGEQVDVLPEFAVAVAAKRDIEVVLEPGGEADVPAPPELGDGCGLVGAVEVLRKVEAEQEGYAYCHVGVAREVAVDLQGVSIDCQEVFESAVEVGLVEDALDEVDGYIVGDDCFLEESGDDVEDACSEHLAGDHEGTPYLQDEIACPDDGACHELRKEADVEGIVEQSVERPDVAPIYIDGVAEGLEGEEGYADGQEDVARLPYDIAQIAARDAGGYIYAAGLEEGADVLA